MSDQIDSENSAIFVARQPILGRGQERIAYELLFRDAQDAVSAEIPDASSATAQVILNAVLNMGTASVLGGVRGFVNCDHEMLASEAIEVLSPECFVLEILETVPDWAAERCAELAALGFELALDDYTTFDRRENLLAVADYVKVDLPCVSEKDLPGLVHELRQHGKKLLAEKVETAEEFQRCLALGFDLFQGYYFAKPTTLSGKAFDPEAAVLLALFRDLSEDTDIATLEVHFKRHVRLGMSLLRLVNSAGMATRNKIESLRHALVFLGRVQLRRWVLVMLYAGQAKSPTADPLLELAAVRGRLLELLLPGCGSKDARGSHTGDAAFLAGMLSLAHVLLDAEPGTVLDELRVEPGIREAVLHRSGLLGALLCAVEFLEAGRFCELATQLDALHLSCEQLVAAQREAYLWAHNLGGSDSAEDAAPA